MVVNDQLQKLLDAGIKNETRSRLFCYFHVDKHRAAPQQLITSAQQDRDRALETVRLGHQGPS